MTKVSYFHDPVSFYELMSSDGLVLKRLDPVSDNMVRVAHHQDDDFAGELTNVNVVIASYTTAYGRLQLYEYLERLGDRCLYFDTGKFIVVAKPS